MEDNFVNDKSFVNSTCDNGSFENQDISLELNSTIRMFGKDKRELSEPAYSIILVCYFVLVCIAGDCL